MNEERGTMTLGGMRIIVNPWVPAGTSYLLGDFDKPPEWETMTEDERLRYATRHGAVLVVQDAPVASGWTA